MRRNPGDWSAKQTSAMHWLQRCTLKSARAWRLKMALSAVHASAAAVNDREHAIEGLAELCAAPPPAAGDKTDQDLERTIRRCRAPMLDSRSDAYGRP